MPRLTVSTTRVVRLSAIAVTIGLALTACSSGSADSGSNSSSSPSVSASPSPSTTGYPVAFKATLNSTVTKINQVGKGDNQSYGVQVLEGTSQINKTSVRVRMLGTFDYTDEGGPVGGFLELVWRDGTVLGLRQKGTATYDSSSKETSIEADLEVINGSGKAVGTTGTGKLTGTRKGSSTSPLKIEVELDLTNAPELITGDSGSRGTPTPSSTYSATIAP